MYIIRKIISFTLLFASILPIVSCSSKDDITVSITCFQVEKADFAQDAFFYTPISVIRGESPNKGGSFFDYRFVVKLTINLDANSDNFISDWGYVYEEADGTECKISMVYGGLVKVTKLTTVDKLTTAEMSLEFCRNEAKSAVKLYSYVLYGGQYHYGNVTEYPLEYTGEESPVDYKGTPVPVDLGLSIKWANCNVGAYEEYEYGGSYAWGETTEKTEFTYENWRWQGDFDMMFYTDVLPSEYDVATVTYGGKWRTPSRAEWQELLDKCNDKLCTDNNVEGVLFTGTNGHSVFIPALNKQTSSYMSLSRENAGNASNFWCSSAKYGVGHATMYSKFKIRAVTE